MSYLSTVLADSPTAVWLLDEASGATAADSSGNGHAATYSGVTSYQQAGPSVALPYAASLTPASSAHVLVPSAGVAVDTTNGVSIEAWVYVRSYSTWAKLFDLGNGQETNNLTVTVQDGLTSDTSAQVNNGTLFSKAHGTKLTLNTWHHVVFTSTAAGVTALYVDGTQIGSDSGYAPAATTRGQAYIGRSSWGDPYLDALIAAAATYPSVLSPTRIAAHHQAGLAFVSLSGSSARTRGASATVAVSASLHAVSARTRGATATERVDVTVDVGSGPGWESNGRTRGAVATIDIDEPVLPVSPFQFIDTQWLTITGPPTFDANHQPESSSWPATEHHGTWGRYRIRVGGKDVTMFRGAVTLINQESYTEPFGDEALILVFPAIPPYEQLGTAALTWLDIDKAVVVEKIDPLGARSVRFEGDVTRIVDNFDGKTGPLQVECTGFGYTLDDRITKPRQTSDPIECGQLIKTFVDYEITYGWNGHPVKTNDSGVATAERGGYGDPLLTVTIQNLLALMQRGEDTLWTLGVNRPRTLKMLIKSRTTLHFDLWCGQRGVTHQLTQDAGRAFDVIFGQGQDHGTNIWQGWVYPNADLDPPAYPLPDGVFFTPGSSHTGFDPFSDELTTRGYHLRSDDTYLAVDEQIIADFQDDMNIQVDGIVGPQTWNTAFTLALNAHLLDAFIRPLALDTHAEPFIYNSRGGQAGKNPHYTGKKRREKLEQYGQLSKSDARRSAKLELPIVEVADWAGTVTLTNIDPPQMCALDILQGMNFTLHGHRGVDRIFHIARTQHQPGLQAGQDRVTTLTVGERADDYVTLAARLTRDRDVVDQSGRTRPPRRRAKQTPDFSPWDSESGAGYLKPRAQTGGLWNVYPIPAGERGQIVHVRLVATVPTLISAAVFNWEVSPNHLASFPGLADPSSGAAGGMDPWQVNAVALTVKPFYDDQPWLAWATGGPGAMQGYWPNTPDVSAPITGILDDASSFPFHARRGKWLFLAVWTRDDCRISGDPAYSYRALWPGPDA